MILDTAGAVVDACRDTMLSVVVGVGDLGGVVPAGGCTGDFDLGTSMREDLYSRDPLSPAMMDSLRCSMVASVYTSWKACWRMVHTSSASAWEGKQQDIKMDHHEWGGWCFPPTEPLSICIFMDIQWVYQNLRYL